MKPAREKIRDAAWEKYKKVTNKAPIFNWYYGFNTAVDLMECEILEARRDGMLEAVRIWGEEEGLETIRDAQIKNRIKQAADKLGVK